VTDLPISRASHRIGRLRPRPTRVSLADDFRKAAADDAAIDAPGIRDAGLPVHATAAGHITDTSLQQPPVVSSVSTRAADGESCAPPAPVRRGGRRERAGAVRRWTPPATAPKRLMSLAETATYLGVSPWTVRELQWKGHLPRVNLSRKLLFDRADVDRLIDRTKDPS